MLLAEARPATRSAVKDPMNQPSDPIHYEVIHTTAGRYRIRIPRLLKDAAYAEQLNWLVASFEFVISVRINQAVGSIVIHYKYSASQASASQAAASQSSGRSDQAKDQASDQAIWLKLSTAIQQASQIEMPAGELATKDEFRPEINWIERMGMPVLSLGLALLVQELLLPIPSLIIGGVVMAASLPFMYRTVETTLKERRLDADVLDALWLGLFTIRGDYVAPALMLSLMESGEVLRDTTARSNERQVMDLLNGIEQFAWVERDGQEYRVPLMEVQKGERVVVYPGNLIPVSGRVLRGTALIDEHKLTGESNLVSRSEGQVVHASTMLLEGKLCILVKRLGHNTRLGIAIQMMQAAPIHDTRVEDYAAKIANQTIAPTLLLSAGIFLATRDVVRAMAPLHLDFSHGIRIAVPSTVLAALTYAARNGIYIRSGRALEMLARVDTIVFDKTGTLTQGNAAVMAIQPADDSISPLDILTYAASAEQGNTHPVAGAILRCAQEQAVQTQPCETWDYRIGMGVVAQIGGARILVGSDRLLLKDGIEVSPIHAAYPHLKTGSHSLVYVAKDGELLGVILYSDPLRPEAARVVGALRCQGKDNYILTGDSQRVAAHVAMQLGIEPQHTYAETFPDRKVEVIKQLRDAGRTVAFIGEGVNDVAALAHADVSISFANGSDIARETADVVLLDDDLRSITHAINIAQRAVEIIYQNTAIVAVPNISVMLAGILFALDPVLGVVISNGSALIAELNSFRPLFDPGMDVTQREVEVNPVTYADDAEEPLVLAPGLSSI